MSAPSRTRLAGTVRRGPGRRWATALALVLAVAGGCGGQVPDREAPFPSVAIPAADPQAPTGGVNAPRHRDADYVVMVSLDGFAADYMHLYEPPTLLAMARGGVWAPEGMTPSFPSKTFPNHYTLVTGLYPARHGIVANTFYDPGRDAFYSIGDREAVEDGTWYGGEPLWVTAERQGMVAASYFWVGSEAAILGVRPSHWRRYDGAVDGQARVDQVLAWLAWPAERRPHLITLYFSETDDAGHRFGPRSPETAAAVARVDGLLRRLLTGLRALPHGDRVHVVVVSDHGMDGYEPSGNRFLEDVVDPTGITVTEAGPAANLWVEGGEDRARRVRDAVNAGLDGVAAYLADEVPPRLRYRGSDRTGDVVLVPDSGVVVWPSRDGREDVGGYTHGWDPTIRSMRALFVARGPRLPSGRAVWPFENVHVYPLVTRILGLEPAEGINGSPSVVARLVR